MVLILVGLLLKPRIQVCAYAASILVWLLCMTQLVVGKGRHGWAHIRTFSKYTFTFI